MSLVLKLLCLILVTFCSECADASFATQLGEVIKTCCTEGTSYARNNSMSSCSSLSPPRVSAEYITMCKLAMDQCCNEYYDKQKECEEGIAAAKLGNCLDITTESGKNCCNECLRGKNIENGDCASPSRGQSTEDLLPADAFAKCCKQTAVSESLRNTTTTTVRTPVPLSIDVTSLCEEYAPNELCAHHCIPVPGSYRCECNPGFKLMSDGKNCIEVVKNRCKPKNSCQHKCNDNGVEVKCSCKRGYQLQADGVSCEDIDECSWNPPICNTGSQCLNVQGSYKCLVAKKSQPKSGQCPPGYTRNPTKNTCDDINECTLMHPPCPKFLCENTIGGYKCGGVSGDPSKLPAKRPIVEDRCPPGFAAGVNEDCEDVDECETEKHDCNNQSQFCINTRGSFYCQEKVSKHCPPGFKINSETKKCEDINECVDSHFVCPADKVCVNVPGAYDCKTKNEHLKINHGCPDGMRTLPGSSECEDIDECLEGTHMCDTYQNCQNTNGSYNCLCKVGYKLDPITGACVDINECATDQHDCILQTQRCDNTIGSYICVRFIACGTGYILHHATGACEDIDECALHKDSCASAGPNFMCVNIPGSFRCVKKPSSTTEKAPPEYEYEYYDVDEEENNITQPINTTVSPILTTTIREENKSIYQSPISKETTQSKNPELPSTDANEDIPKKATNEESSINTIPDESSYSEPTNKDEDKTTPHIVFLETTDKNSTVSNIKPVDIDKNGIKQTSSTVCKKGFQENKYGACVDIDECATNTHVCSGLIEICKNNIGGYVCECAVGLRRDFITKECVPIPSTTSTTIAPSTPMKNINNFWGIPNYKFTRRPFRARTLCDPGYTMNMKTGVCEDINECTNGQTVCADVEVCVNTEGSYRCDCLTNWVLDETKHRCVSIRDKNKFPSGYENIPGPTDNKNIKDLESEIQKPTITKVEGHVILKCKKGYKLSSDNVCEDIDECIIGLAECGPKQICTNHLGGYSCSCPPGHNLVGDHECEDVDECALAGNEPLCSNNADCVNTIGSYQCKCHKGFKPAPANPKVCVDVNECDEARSGSLCQQTCKNLWGSYTCACHRGYRLNADNKTCSDIDECTEFKSKRLCVGKCVNELGSYRCTCPDGYTLSPDRKSCIDIDECATGLSKCVQSKRTMYHTDFCFNIRGGYKCEKIYCPAGYMLQGESRCTKIKTQCDADDWNCIYQPNYYSHNYMNFVSNLVLPDGKADLYTMKVASGDAKKEFNLKVTNVDAPPNVLKANIDSFLLTVTDKNAVVSIVKPIEGPQRIELELSVKMFFDDVYAGLAIAKLFIFVSEYEF